ncbi:MAG TPA: class I SAM-dependent methyltransferase [Thermoanaerobaculia bacterium]|jgi:SAM-dependent methyltransferase|nr:class I SAM-dependent methyltransferase [Thermoanaerobaculia bacterium]
MPDFYGEFAPLYHLIFQDWDASIERQGRQLAAEIRSSWPGCRTVLDVSCGIGTQALALAMNGFQGHGLRCVREGGRAGQDRARRRGLEIAFSVCDMREAYHHHGGGFDVVVSGDNSIPHLLTDEDISIALRQMFSCLRPGGGCLLTVRDYDQEPRGTNIVKPYGARIENGKRYLGFQVWDFEGEHYDFTLYFVEEDLSSKEVQARALRSRYYAVSTCKLLALMQEAGFEDVRRLDEVFYQPVLAGTRPGVKSDASAINSSIIGQYGNHER